MKPVGFSMLSAAVVLAACHDPKPAFNSARAIDAIRAGEVQWNLDWKSGDAGKVTAHYAPEALVMDPGAAPAKGAAAIRAGVQKAMDDPGFSLSFNSDKVDVAASGDLAVSRGAFKLTMTDPATKAAQSSTGTFVTVYKPQPDGSWKAIWDIATAGPAPGPASK
jgi:ketosteroid isomerase-like protein